MKDRVIEMRHLVIIGGISLVVMFTIMSIAGCGSSKSNLRQESSVEENLNYTCNDGASASKEVTKTETEESTEETEEITTVYDTSKPIDPVTGKPPIKSETRKNILKEVGKKVAAKESTQTNVYTNKQSYAKKKKCIVEEEHKQKEEPTVLKQIGGVVWALFAFIVIIIVAWLLHRLLRK